MLKNYYSSQKCLMLSKCQIGVNIAKLQETGEKGGVDLKHQAKQYREPWGFCCFSCLKALQSKAANLVHFVNTDLNLQGFEVMSF